MKIKKMLKTLGLLMVMLVPLTSMIAYADTNENVEEPIKFTEETQAKVEYVNTLLKDAVVIVDNGYYDINIDSPKLEEITEEEMRKIEDHINFFNESIELGLLELDENNSIISSTNYEINHNLGQIMRAMVVSIKSTLKNNANTMYRVWYQNWQTYGENIGYIETGKFFASKVRSGGDWDYKLVYGPTTSYYIEDLSDSGEYLTGEDIGNLNYGYVGRTVFGAELLCSAAGAYQIYSGTSQLNWYKTYFDDPNDQYWINRGISLKENNSL